ncbi:MAG: metal-dependent hydrolase, partial [Bacteroidota bacterium]
MDSLTQVALGAAVGHAAAGHTLGRRALLLGGIAGTLPDLDILAYPFLDPAGELRFHRGLTHGLLFAFWAGPLFGALAWRFARWRGLPEAAGAGTWTPYAAVFFWGFLTHAPLDAFTVYGTQLLAPFLNTPYAVSSVFIIDPLVTVPLLIGLAVALWAGSRPVGRKAVAVALAVMTVYLGWSVGAQAQARSTVEAASGTRTSHPR